MEGSSAYNCWTSQWRVLQHTTVGNLTGGFSFGDCEGNDRVRYVLVNEFVIIEVTPSPLSASRFLSNNI